MSKSLTNFSECKTRMDGGDGGEANLCYTLYLNPNLDEVSNENKREIPQRLLEDAIVATNPTGRWKVTKTSCGLLASFSMESDSLALLNTPLAEVLCGPVQVARFSSKDTRYKQSLIIHDVPWAIPLQELKTTLENQGIHPVAIERVRQNIKVEITDPSQYETLLRYGVDFFGATRFAVTPDRWRTVIAPKADNNHESVLQCYRCQGFWHIAANCEHMPRCVRCGEGHSVDVCTRPRHDPVCCHCSGPHHAAYRQCPVRLQLMNSTPVSLTLSSTKSYPALGSKPIAWGQSLVKPPSL